MIQGSRLIMHSAAHGMGGDVVFDLSACLCVRTNVLVEAFSDLLAVKFPNYTVIRATGALVNKSANELFLDFILNLNKRT